MKTLSLFFAGFALCFVSSLNGGEVAVWMADQAKESKGKMLIPDPKGGIDLELADSVGVKIGDKPTVGTDTKSLVFSGSQKKHFRSLSPFPAASSQIKVKFALKPSETSGEEDGTILRGPQWEMRYNPKTSKLGFIVWHEGDNTFTATSVPVVLGSWQEVVGEVEGGKITIAAGKETSSKPLGGEIRPAAGNASIILGASRAATADQPASRPFFGSVAEIRISVD